MSADRVLLEIKTTRSGEETVEAMAQILSSLTSMKKVIIPTLLRLGLPLSFEITVLEQSVRFFVSVPEKYASFLEGQLVSQYPKASISKIKDYLPDLFTPEGSLVVGQLKLAHHYLYPIKTYKDFGDVDPLASVLGALSKATVGDRIAIQYLIVPVSGKWQSAGHSAAKTKHTTSEGTAEANPYAKVIMDKISQNGFKTAIRIAVNSADLERSRHLLSEVANSFSSFNNPSGNSLVYRKVYLWQRDRLKKAMLARNRSFVPSQILNVSEIATLFHFPSEKLSTIKNIAWQKNILSEPPENLPVAENLSDEEKKDVNFFAKTEFKNKPTVFGIKGKDRRRHVYIIGKTGSGKSTLIANMAINDMRNRKGFCVVDPHGDLCETLLDFVPSYRVNDVIYLDPSDIAHPFTINPLEVTNEAQKELVISGIVAIFHKLYATSWGPRLEYILRNTLMSVAELPEPTLMMVPEMLANEKFRKEALLKIQDPVLKSYWENEFASYTERLRAEAIAPIQNKVGQFVSSPTIRNIIQHHKSTIDLEAAMNDGKIILLNLSQGRLGEDNAALLGAMIITKIQLAAMNRVNIKEEDRRDFYLYVDEFQNFATSSFIKILSEARKYRLNLILANQYIAQIPEDVRAAIFGNAATMLSFLIGAQDTPYMAKEFSERFKEEDLLSLGNYQSITKLSIDNISSAPFLAYTLPLPYSATQNREKVVRSSQERYSRKG